MIVRAFLLINKLLIPALKIEAVLIVTRDGSRYCEKPFSPSRETVLTTMRNYSRFGDLMICRFKYC
jgi:hypothetical protein